MRFRRLFIFPVLVLTAGCGGDKHLPSSNPPEYDPKKVYTTPAGLPSTPATVSKPTEFERLKAQLESLEAGQKVKDEGKKVPFDPNSFQLFKGATSPCEVLSRLVPGLGSTQLFAGQEGTALRKALGPEADGIARRMDEQLAEGLRQSLGPEAVDCPISVRPRKSSFIDRSPSPRVVLAHTTSGQPLLLSQTTMPDTYWRDYDVDDPPMRVEEPPRGWVGYKTADAMTRIGKEDRPTKGIREHYEMVIAPMAEQCPHLEGPDRKGMVDGTFEWSFLLMRAITGSDGSTQAVLYRRHVVATLMKGEVDDDAKVKQVDFEVTVTLQHIGTELAPYSRSYSDRGYFTLNQRTGLPEELRIITVSGFSEGEAQIKDAQLLGTLTALVAFFSGQVYSHAKDYWNHPNTCVDIVFNPATKTQRFAPNRSFPVKTELRTNKEQASVPAKFKEAKERPREGNGTVTPREEKSERDRPATFTYRTRETRMRHSGFRVKAISRAGVAEAQDGEWELADSGLRLRFHNRIQADPQSLKAKGGFAQFDGTVQFEILLEPVPHAEGMFRGEINLVRPMVVRHVKYGTCGSASRTEHWLVTAHVNPKSESMDVQFGFTTSNEQGSWTCGGVTDALHDDLFGILESVNMPTRTGIKKDFNARNQEFLEWLSMEVVEGVGEQAGER
ncbi:MAG: hypothetical protein A4E19_02330 [Nitrospira sp. SG-bin1]|nr:MAG: hypothetical protein A4E19_02330 [Nitrospira sp. SG-bin1]